MEKRTVNSDCCFKNIVKKLVLFLCLFLLIENSVQQCLTSQDDRFSTSRRSRDALYRGQQDFSLALLAEINKHQKSTENVFFSPYSTYHALIMAYFLSANQTERALHSTLRLGADQDKRDILQAYKLDKYITPYKFNGANKIYYSSDLRIRDCMESLFNSELESLDFKNDPVNAVNHINKWVESQTNGMIADLLPGDAVDQETRLVLVNAAYFKGQWQSRFQPENTHTTIFYVTPSENTIVDMMTQEGTFNHGESLFFFHAFTWPTFQTMQVKAVATGYFFFSQRI